MTTSAFRRTRQNISSCGAPGSSHPTI